jgi:hypothetical protein
VTRVSNDRRRLAFRALLDACRLWLSTETTGALLDARLDWDTFERLAFIHNFEPLLHRLQAEGRLCRTDIPIPLRDRWERQYFENFVFNTRALEIIQPLCDACAGHGLSVVLIKGPVTSARVYADPALRIMVDIDILCRPEDAPAVARLVRQAGFLDGGKTAVYHSHFWHRDSNLPLELHFGLYEFLPDAGALLASVLDSVEPCRLDDGCIVPAPAPHLETAIEIAHLVNHDLRVNLKPLLDLAGGLRELSSRALLRQTLGEWDLMPEAAIVGELLRRFFQIETVLSDEGPSPDRGLIDALAINIEHAGAQERSALEELATRPGLRAKIAYLRRLLEPPSDPLEALPGRLGRTRLSARLAHLSQTLRRGWDKAWRGGFAAAGAPSIKRAVFRRRARR